MNISVIVPLFNEEDSLSELCSWIDRVMQKNNFSYELILIDDGSKDNSWSVIENISVNNTSIKGVKFRRNYGKSAALRELYEETGITSVKIIAESKYKYSYFPVFGH